MSNNVVLRALRLRGGKPRLSQLTELMWRLASIQATELSCHSKTLQTRLSTLVKRSHTVPLMIPRLPPS